MSRSLSAALLVTAVTAALAGSACGVYGPPKRAQDRAAASAPPQPAAAPAEAEETAAPDQEP
jgi:hypothetical protein